MSYEQVARILAGGLHWSVRPLSDQRAVLHSAQRLLPASDAGTSAETSDQGIYGHDDVWGEGCFSRAVSDGAGEVSEAEIEKVKQSNKGSWA